ncbi:unnamed protein product [Ambrosiozyma monospora]|uniref:Unnamed protein product n=1 Tax=Ambrosiozyma monospora TaxID=43982 RepID=A0ACB5U3J7_AMBMO|nr:unnamed protein product [Ambrosiozyma monospora]
MDLLDREWVQKLRSWRSHCACDCVGVCHCKGECECAGYIKKRVVLSFSLDYSDSDSASVFVSKLIDLNRNEGFEIEYHEMRAHQPLCLHLLSNSNDDNIRLFELLDLKSPFDNHGLKDLEQITRDTDKINTVLTEDYTPDYQERPAILAMTV